MRRSHQTAGTHVSRVIHDRGWGHCGGLLFSDFLCLARARDKAPPIKPKTCIDGVYLIGEVQDKS